jgi:two-component sensor histidine kinase
MALIHERLYKSENLSRIKACEYIKNLTEYLESTFIAQSGNIEMKTEVDDVYLSLDVAIPCGLIINELVSNSMKHAFKDRKKGKLFVQLKFFEGKNLRLVVKDNGVGIPKLSNNENSSLGLQLVDLLVKQINGKINIDNSEGTKFEITFPLQHL